MLAAPSAAAPPLAAAAAAKPPRTPTLALHRTLLHAASSSAPSTTPAPVSRQPVPPSPRPPAKRPHGARPTRRASKRTSPNGGSSSSGSSSNGSSGSKKASGATQSGTPAGVARSAPAMQGTSSSTSTASTSGPTPTSTTMAPRAAATNAATPAQTPVVRAPATDDARAGMPHATAWAPIPPSPAEAVTTTTTAVASKTTTTSTTRDHVTLPAHALPTPAASYAVVDSPKQQQEPAAPASKTTCSNSMTTSFLMASPPQSPVIAAAPPHAPTHDGAATAKDDAIPALALAHEVPTAPKLAAASIPTPPAVEHAHPLQWIPSTTSSSSSLPKPTRALSTASDASSDLASTARIVPAALAKLSAAPASAPAKRRLHLGDFQLLETLGTGTFGRVHLARHRSASNQYYAMKVLAKTDVVRLKQVAHINSERAILARVHHPFLVNMVATFHDARNLYMLLEYVSGGELFTYLRRVGRLHPNAARFYAAEIVTAIEHLHAREITYRDLKPENLLIDAQGHIKITDFGFAKVVPDRTWTLCGTPEYLAPEIIKGTGHGKAVDWWSLGILIFELLCGYPPFYDDSPYGIYEKILAGRLQFPAFVDAAARDLIRNLLAHDWTKRLGALKGGASDIKNHRWFANIDWDELVARRVTPPMVPRVHGPGDTNNFEKYPEPDPNALTPCWTAPDHYGHLFPEF